MSITKIEPERRVKLKDCETGWAQNEEAIFLGKGELKERARWVNGLYSELAELKQEHETLSGSRNEQIVDHLLLGDLLSHGNGLDLGVQNVPG